MEIGEFGPYGAIAEDEAIRMVGYYQEVEEDGIPDSKVAISVLKRDFLGRFETGEIGAAAIAYDVALTTTDSDGSYSKRDALCICVSTNGDKWSEEYFPYLVLDGQCIWK